MQMCMHTQLQIPRTKMLIIRGIYTKFPYSALVRCSGSPQHRPSKVCRHNTFKYKTLGKEISGEVPGIQRREWNCWVCYWAVWVSRTLPILPVGLPSHLSQLSRAFPGTPSSAQINVFFPTVHPVSNSFTLSLKNGATTPPYVHTVRDFLQGTGVSSRQEGTCESSILGPLLGFQYHVDMPLGHLD